MPDNSLSFNGFRIYPRGFVGASVGVPPRPITRPYQVQVHRHQFHPEMFKLPKSPVEVNQNIENIWTHFLKHNHAIFDFDFREKVLKVALTAFGTLDFKLWAMTQFDAPTTGDLHAEFLEDTFNFIQYGKRKLTLANWLPLLTLSNPTANVNLPTEEIKAFFIEPETKRERNVALIDVIQRWCHHEGGFEDMIQTLHVLFGDIAA